MTTEQEHNELPDDLGYCRGSRKEKIAMLESKCRPQQQSSPDLSTAEPGDKKKIAMLESKWQPQQQSSQDISTAKPWTAKYQTGNGQTRPARRTHSEDIKERTKLLEKAMFKDNCTQDLGNKINKNDPNYGKPQQGTLTEFRGQKAHTHVHKEILELCEFIYMNGEEDEDCEDQRSMMLFGDLFKLYTRISDKVVGILLRAKKYGLVGFEPEILFQSRDDDEPVILIKPMQEIYDIFNQHKSFAPQPTQSSNKES